MRWLLFAPLLVLLVLFALSNLEDVQVRLWPFDLVWSTTLSVAVLAISALAFLLGAALAWTAALPDRRRGRKMEETARLLEAELAQYRAREQEAARAATAGGDGIALSATAHQPSIAAPRP